MDARRTRNASFRVRLNCSELAEVLSSSDHLAPFVLQHPSEVQTGLESFTEEKEGGF